MWPERNMACTPFLARQKSGLAAKGPTKECQPSEKLQLLLKGTF